MNQSFWIKLAGAKSKTLACTVVAALTVALLFMVCSKDEGGDDPTPTPNPGVCDNGPTTACCAEQPNYQGCYTPPTDPCASGPTAACCADQPNYQGCSTPGGNSAYCRYDNDPDNCWPIGPAQDVKTDAECRAAYGEPVNSCGAVSQLQYCYWGPGECYPISDPNAPCNAPCDAGLTQLQNCQRNGFVSNSPTCSDAPTEEYYCYWDKAEGGECVRIPNPNAENPDNPGMTEKDVCDAWGFLTSSPTCADYVKPAVTYYCDWGAGGCWKIMNPDAPKTDCGSPAGSEDCPSGMTNKSGCEEWGTLLTQNAGQPVPSGCQ
jgi:hypothetical protein